MNHWHHWGGVGGYTPVKKKHHRDLGAAERGDEHFISWLDRACFRPGELKGWDVAWTSLQQKGQDEGCNGSAYTWGIGRSCTWASWKGCFLREWQLSETGVDCQWQSSGVITEHQPGCMWITLAGNSVLGRLLYCLQEPTDMLTRESQWLGISPRDRPTAQGSQHHSHKKRLPLLSTLPPGPQFLMSGGGWRGPARWGTCPSSQVQPSCELGKGRRIWRGREKASIWM